MYNIIMQKKNIACPQSSKLERIPIRKEIEAEF